MRTNINCCKDCQDRNLNCHSKCDKYAKEKKELNSFKDKKYKEKDAERSINKRKYV